MQRALVAVVLVSLVGAVVGTFVIHKGLAFIGDAVAHSSLAGVATAFVLGGNVFLGALAWAVPAAVLMGYVSRRGRLNLDAAIGIVFAGGFALGILIISRVPNYTVDLFSFVFGNVLGVSPGDLAIVAVVALGILLLVGLFFKELLFSAYDPTMAAASGIPVGLVQYALLTMVALTVVVSLKTVGVVLVVALLITPPATAALLARRFPRIMALAAVFGLASAVLGLYLSYYANLASGAAIVLIATGFFLLAFLFAPGRGLLVARRRPPAASPPGAAPTPGAGS
ncbi:MAG: metal ABC transporter permease [Chloroflexi bacterium]|nr:metal ABC transporter permease [Chloroflexota bacterium]